MLRQRVFAICVCAVLFALPGAVGGQDQKSIIASASGEGTLRLGKEKFKVHAVVIKLLEDGKAELNLLSDITIFIPAAWTRTDSASRTIELTTTDTKMEGGGQLLLREDGKSIAGLKLEVFNRISGKTVTVEFVAK